MQKDCRINIGDKFFFRKVATSAETILEGPFTSVVGSAMHHPDYWVLGDNGMLYDRNSCFKATEDADFEVVQPKQIENETSRDL